MPQAFRRVRVEVPDRDESIFYNTAPSSAQQSPPGGNVNAEDFRRIALGMKDTVESAHMNHPDFRVRGKIFDFDDDPDTEAQATRTVDTPAQDSEIPAQ